MELSVRLVAFQRFLLDWHQRHGRHNLPWRQTTDPYAIMVSELMLQQTQVERVIPKFEAFLTQFPTLEKLAQAELAEVLIAWQGLGYNRRAKFLWQLALQVTSQHKGQMPTEELLLRQLSGLGPYTASAIMAFAYDRPTVLIETNVRTVFLYHFFPDQTSVTDTEILTLVTASLPVQSARKWYSALMDYGSYLKSILPNPSRRSRAHVKQSTFAGSARQVRGEIIRLLAQQRLQGTQSLSENELKAQLTSNLDHFKAALTTLEKEGLVVRSKQGLELG